MQIQGAVHSSGGVRTKIYLWRSCINKVFLFHFLMKLYLLTVENKNIIKYAFLFHQLKIMKLNQKNINDFESN
jgi:hypothetical protein